MKKNHYKAKKSNFSHFLSIPFRSKSDRSRIEDYQKNILRSLRKEEVSCLKPNSPNKFHLTLGMLNLDTEEKRKSTWEIIKKSESFIKDALSNTTVEFGGISTFEAGSGSRKSPKVFFIEVKNTYTLELVSDHIIRQLMQAKIIDLSDKSTYSQLKLNPETKFYSVSTFHLTMFRVKVRAGELAPDYAELLKGFSEVRLEPLKVSSLDVSTRFREDEDGFYKPLIRVDVE